MEWCPQLPSAELHAGRDEGGRPWLFLSLQLPKSRNCRYREAVFQRPNLIQRSSMQSLNTTTQGAKGRAALVAGRCNLGGDLSDLRDTGRPPQCAGTGGDANFTPGKSIVDHARQSYPFHQDLCDGRPEESAQIESLYTRQSQVALTDCFLMAFWVGFG